MENVIARHVLAAKLYSKIFIYANANSSIFNYTLHLSSKQGELVFVKIRALLLIGSSRSHSQSLKKSIVGKYIKTNTE